MQQRETYVICPVCEEENTYLTMVWEITEQRFVCEDCWRPQLLFDIVYWGA